MHSMMTPGEEQQQIATRFPEALSDSQLIHWRPAQRAPSKGSFILVGVAVAWNLYDQELVASLDDAVAEGRVGGDQVAVFSADLLTRPEEVASFIPGLADVAQSPYVGWWQEGKLRYAGSGPTATSFICDRYGLKLL